MPAINQKVTSAFGKVTERALEMGFYLPLGVYDRVSDAVAGLDADQVRTALRELTSRGQSLVEPVERRIRRQKSEIERSVGDAAGGVRRDAKSNVRQAATAGEQATMSARVAVPKKSQLPISGYDDKTVDEIVSTLDGLTNAELAKIYKYESANDNRTTVLHACEAKMIDLPVPTYDALTVTQLRSRLSGMSKKDLETIRSYEASTKRRKTVLDSIDAKLSA